MFVSTRHLGLAVLGAALLAAGTGQAMAQKPGELTLDPTGATTARLGYMPIQVKLTGTKPTTVVKEPDYVTAPMYGTIALGKGGAARYTVAVDEPLSADWKIYVDANRNGDLTDDGNGAWAAKSDRGGRVMYGVQHMVLKAGVGKSAPDCGLAFYRFAGNDYLLMYRESARTGTVELDGKSHKVLLVENDADGVYDKAVKTVAEAKQSRPVWLRIDTNDDGKFASGTIDIRAPFKLGDKTYEAVVSDDGSKLSVKPTRKVALDLTPKAPPRPALLKAGVAAPDFTAEKLEGGNLKLSDYKGSVVVLDFWATWCGPCMQSMPHIQNVYKATKDQGVVVLAVCVWDEKTAYQEWIPKNREKFGFQFAFDPAGRGDNGIAKVKFNVSGIPTTYIIDKDGKVADAIVGYQDGDKRVEEALKKLGVKID